MATTGTSDEPRGPRRRALVTGASAGIGAAFAERLARDQYDLVLVARSRDRLDALAKRIRDERGMEAEVLAADLTLPEELARVEKAIAADSRLELLVNNAGFGTYGPFAELDPEREELEIRLNVIALVRLARAALPVMLARGHGSIVNVSSLAGWQPCPHNATYGATKAFVNSFTEALHEELRGSGVKVQALCPGFTRTEFQERAGIDTSSLPDFAWMEPAQVVEASLEGLRRGEVLCVPGVHNKALAAVTSVLPRALTRRMAGAIVRRLGM
jgi:short-subunit dehydrogenase